MLAPCEGPQAEHRSQLDVRAYALHEAHGMIFLWLGDGEPQGEPPWFERITPDYHSSGFTSEWQCNYLRATEVQLDWAHLPFVHHNSIGRGFDPAIDVTHELEGDSLRTWDRRFEDEPGNPRFYLHLMFPNIWMNPVRFGMFGFLALAPIDEGRTQLYIRVYQNKVRLPVLRSAVTWLMNKVNGIITNQDQGVVEGQPSVFTPDIRDERLTASDKPIAAYRKEMRRRMRASSEDGD